MTLLCLVYFHCAVFISGIVTLSGENMFAMVGKQEAHKPLKTQVLLPIARRRQFSATNGGCQNGPVFFSGRGMALQERGHGLRDFRCAFVANVVSVEADFLHQMTRAKGSNTLSSSNVYNTHFVQIHR